jgi:hypothetical protein
MRIPSANPKMNPQKIPIMLPQNVGAYPMSIEDISSIKGLPRPKSQDTQAKEEIKIAPTTPNARPKFNTFRCCFSVIFLPPCF